MAVDLHSSRGWTCQRAVAACSRGAFPLTPVPSPLPGARGAGAIYTATKTQNPTLATVRGRGGPVSAVSEVVITFAVQQFAECIAFATSRFEVESQMLYVVPEV